MSETVGGIFTSHVPGIGAAIAKGLQQDPYWKPFFDGFAPVHEVLAREKPDVAVVFYNDHGLNFFLDKMPTFAIGAAADYRHEDEGWGIGGFKPFVGHSALSWHVIEQVVGDEFDPVTCQSMLVDHGVCVPFGQNSFIGKVKAWSTSISWQVVTSNSLATRCSMMCQDRAESPGKGRATGMPQPSSALRYSFAAPIAKVGILSRKKLRPWSL